MGAFLVGSRCLTPSTETGDSFFTRWRKDPQTDELTFLEAVQCLERLAHNRGEAHTRAEQRRAQELPQTRKEYRHLHPIPLARKRCRRLNTGR